MRPSNVLLAGVTLMPGDTMNEARTATAFSTSDNWILGPTMMDTPSIASGRKASAITRTGFFLLLFGKFVKPVIRSEKLGTR